MKITFLTGRSGEGKSRKAYDLLIEKAVKNPKDRFFLIVPEQFTMQAQKNIVDAHLRKGTFNIDIVSFNRLAYRVFEELGVSLLKTIDDTGKNLILRKVIDDNRSQFKIIKVKDTQGFVSEIKSVISELLQYSVSADMLALACDKLAGHGINGNERLRLKLMDIMIIYKAFREYISEKYITTEEITQILCRHIPDSSILSDSTIVFDGFTGFTPVQYQLIELLFDKAAEMYFTVTIGDVKGELDEEQLFSMSMDMMKRIGKLAEKNGIFTYEERVAEREVPYRFQHSEALAHLEKNIFRKEGVYDKKTEEICIYSALGKKAEVKYVTAAVRHLVEEEGYRYKDIGVIVSSMEDYRELIMNGFEDSGIPAFIDSKRSIMSNPAVEYLRAALQVIEKDYSYESLFRLLKSYMCGLDREDVDLMENYVLALGIRGHKKWNEKMFRNYPARRLMDLDKINEVRIQIAEVVEDLYQAFTNKENRVIDYVKAIYAFLEKEHVEEKTAALQKKMEEEGQASLAKEHGQVYENIIKLLEQIASLLGDEEMKIQQFSDILDAGFQEIKVGIIPPTADMVMVGDVERTRLDQVKVVIFAGVNEGYVPKTSINRGLFSEAEREILLEADFELSPTARQKAYMQNFYLYLLLTKPSDKLILTVNKEERPSKLIHDIRKLFPNSLLLSDETIDPLSLIHNVNDGILYAFGQLGEGEKLSEDASLLLKVLAGKSELAARIRELAQRTIQQVTDEEISQYAAKLLYGEILMGSVSRMETYAACAFSHFASYGLALEERKLYEIGMADLGTLFHEALRIYSFRLSEEKYDFATIPEELRTAYVEDAVERAIADYNNTIFFDNSRNSYMKKKIQSIMNRTTWALGSQIQAGKFVPAAYEKEFVFEKDGMKIRGKIDRIDYAYQDDKCYVKIMDYKSGKKDFEFGKLYDGLQLQLMVYLESLIEDKIPAAAMYYTLDNPIVDYEDGKVNEQKAEDLLLQALRPTGIVNMDKEVISLLEKRVGKGKSNNIPVTFNQNGSLSVSSQAVTEDGLRLMGKYSVKKMTDIGKEITKGIVKVNPFKESCIYCPYKSICGFDISRAEYHYRKSTELKGAEIWQKFTEALAEKEE